MKLQHNIGGLEGLDPINTEVRVFVEPWEKRIFGVHVAMMALSNHLGNALPQYSIDSVPTIFEDFWTWGHLRQGAENIHPFEYFRLRYYEKWLGGISGFFVEKGYITQGELDARTAEFLENDEMASIPDPIVGNIAIDDQVLRYLREGDSPKRPISAEPKFKVGDRVRVKNMTPGEHTRLPGMLRDKIATVERVYEDGYNYFFPTRDGLGDPMPVYSLVFDPVEIWNEELVEPNMVYYNEIFEVYLEAA